MPNSLLSSKLLMLRASVSQLSAIHFVLSLMRCAPSALPLLLHLLTVALRWQLRVSRPWQLAAVFVPSEENDMTVEYIVLTPEQMLVLFNVLEG